MKLTNEARAAIEAEGLSVAAIAHTAATHAGFIRLRHPEMHRSLTASGTFDQHCLDRAIEIERMRVRMETQMADRIRQTKPREAWDAESVHVPHVVAELIKDEAMSL